ncbi:MAG: DUF4190 domain-containing protein [Planctomycetota bacterium]|jgi:prepilin-type processing-associated H-X9-DG protein
MSGAETEAKTQKARTSELAIASLVLSLLVPSGWFLLPALVDNVPGLPDSKVFPWLMGLIWAVGLFWLAVPVFSIVALVKIKKSGGLLKGRGFAIAGLCLWLVIAIPYLLSLFPRDPGTLPPRVVCGTNMSRLVKVMVVYANNDELGRFPTADKWCDLLLELDYVSEKQFVCPEAGEGRCHYAMNPNAGTAAANPDMVLLFETKGGWNQFGGPEILTTENHKGKGCNVAFVDTHVESVKTSELGKLKWK